MADTSVTERRIRPILDAMSAGNWKQALKDCEKWQKKGESSDRFLALRAAVFMRQSDEKQQERGANETLQLCRRKNPVLNFEAIHQLQDSLKLMSLEDTEGPKLWERAVAAQPTDEDLMTTWLENSVAVSSWQNAQKATMALRKAFPKERKYDFWNILMCYLIHQDERIAEKDRKLFGTLANRMIVKAAQPTPPEKMISNHEELVLLATILLSTGAASEFVQLLQSEHLRPLVEQDEISSDSLLFDAIDIGNEPAAIDQLLARISTSDGEQQIPTDDRVWSLFTKSAQSPETRQARLQQVEEVLKNNPQHRQAYLAKIDLLAEAVDDSKSSESLLSTSRDYYDLFGSKAFAFDDLVSRLRTAGVESVRKFCENLKVESSTSSASLQELFILKLEFHLLFSEDFSTSKVLQFVSKALQLYVAAGDNQSVAPESGLIAAFALLRLATKTQSTTLRVQASMILHTACKSFKDYYMLRVVLLQIQAFSGQLSLAMDNFFHLSVKNLQWETVGHFILTRISTLHPQKRGHNEDAFNPLGAFDTALTVFNNWQRSLDRAIREGLKHESYSNVVETVQLRNNLQNSIIRRMYTIEQRKCQRALQVAIGPKFEPHDGDLPDLRDTLFIPQYGIENQMLSESLQCGPRPSDGWVNAMTLHECLMTYLTAELIAPSPAIIATALENLTKSELKAPTETASLTEDERRALSIYRDLVTIISQVVNKNPSNAQSLENAIIQIKDSEWQVKPACLNGVEYPDWQYLHHQYVKLEVLRTIADFTGVLFKKSKTGKNKTTSGVTEELKNSLEEMKPLVSDQMNAVYEQVKGLKQQLSASGVLGKLVDAVLGRTDETSEEHEVFAERMAALQDEAAVEEYCGSLRESWEDALDGILAVKIKMK